MSWKRAFERSPCPICGHLRNCTASDDGKVINCTRSPNDRPIANRKTGELVGYLWPSGAHAQTIIAAPAKAAAAKLSLPEIMLVHRQHRTAVNPHRLKVHARQLGVSIDSLNALSIGWDGHRQAWTFPMVDEIGRVVGLRYRRDDGAKWSLSGGSEGIFKPSCDNGGPLIVCEGPSSAAAWLSLGFDAIGRPSCNSGSAILSKVFAGYHRHVLIVADRDSRKKRNDGSFYWPGQDGAAALYEILKRVCMCTWVVCPVPKDARDWIKRGVTPAEVREWVNRLGGRQADRGVYNQTVSPDIVQNSGLKAVPYSGSAWA